MAWFRGFGFRPMWQRFRGSRQRRQRRVTGATLITRIQTAPAAIIDGYERRYVALPESWRDTEADAMTSAEILEQTRRDFAAAIPAIRAEGARHVARLRARDPLFTGAYHWDDVENVRISPETAIALVQQATRDYEAERTPAQAALKARRRAAASYKRLAYHQWMRDPATRARVLAMTADDWRYWKDFTPVTAQQLKQRDAYVLGRRRRR